MCAPVQDRSCNCFGSCGCVSNLTIEDEISMLESARQRMQVQINAMDRRIEGLKKKF